MIITFEGKDWQFDREKINTDEWRELQRKYKMTPKRFEEGISEAHVDASTFLYWILLRQSGDQRAVLGDHLKPDIIALNAAIGAADADEPDDDEDEPAADEAGPTRSGGRRPGSPPGKATPAPSQPHDPAERSGHATA